MLDTETKRRIDNARDILVGKVPDPKSQVEQITIALIYKFMDDMDAQSIELGGKATFFTGEYEKYGWRKVFDPRLGGFDMLALYSDAIVKLNQNPNVPQLFRDIFKNAYLPYRDPETLKLFLKTIDEFKYDHSERLGDAFEYLLSVLGSQGDAGQFRTPRHIIDFIVDVVDPQKGDRILDPACGTAGFLISAYKHIVGNNPKLTPKERKKLMSSVVGYDISPDMVRLSLANMYLHGFETPEIHEYDTLTSEDRWNEYYDVIMANPPFMSPKGGIKPHKKFSIDASRSEVLFVDYIAEHINPMTGRAGIIVPEGIVFQSANAYKDLRKMLVEKAFLYAVVSLPAGVFNPYSGVKTSILFLDKQLAAKSDRILFVKIASDGFGLGAQRREINQNDLPDALNLIRDFRLAVTANDFSRLDEAELPLQATAVEKARIAENGEYNLSGERYRSARVVSHKYEVVKIGDVCDLATGGTPPSTVREYYEDGTIKWLVSGDIHKREIFDCEGRITELGMQNSNAKFLPINSVLIALNGQGKTRGTVAILRTKATCNQSLVAMIPKDPSRLLSEYLFAALTGMYSQIRNLTGAEERSGLSMSLIRGIGIPLPPLSVQREIVAKIETCQRIIDGARAVVENYKPQLDILPDWESVRLREITDITSSKRIFQDEYVSDGVPFYRTKEVVELSKGKEVSLELFISNERFEEIKQNSEVPRQGEILLSAVGTIGISYVIPDNRPFYFKDGNLLWLRNLRNVSPYYLKLVLDDLFANRMHELSFGAAYNAITIVKLKEVQIALPPLEVQHAIVSRIAREQTLVIANNELVEIFEQKIKDEIDKLWEE
jgi:type I restriction enzyme M protein